MNNFLTNLLPLLTDAHLTTDYHCSQIFTPFYFQEKNAVTNYSIFERFVRY